MAASWILLALAFFLAVGCGSSDGPPDGGAAIDGGVASDGGPAVDGGAGADGGPGFDGGTGPDGGTTSFGPNPLPPYTGATDAVFLPSTPDPGWKRAGDVNLTRMRVNEAWASTTGAPETIIAILDTGFPVNHPLFDGHTVPGRDLVLEQDDVVDEHGHGTMLAAAAAAHPTASMPVQGVCTGCRLMPIRVTVSAVIGEDFDVVDTRIAAGLRLARDRGARVALVGMVADAYPPQTAAAVREVSADGVVVVAPAGNDGHLFAGYPARLPEVVGVAPSLASADVPMRRANGPLGVDLWAPADPTFLPVPSGTTERLSDASLAAAYVAGVAGLLKTLHPGLTGTAVRSILMATAVPLLPGESSQRVRGGRVDAREAVRLVYPAPATDQIADLGIPYAQLLPRQPRPGQVGRVRARLENRGTLPVDLGDAVIRLWEGNQATWFEAGTGLLAPGEARWFEVPHTAAAQAGGTPLVVEVGEKPGHRIGGPGVATFPGNDAHRVLHFSVTPPDADAVEAVTHGAGSTEVRREVEVSAAQTRDLVLLDLVDATPEERAPTRTTLVAVYANAGNAVLRVGVTASVEGMSVASLPEEDWLPGERRELEISIDHATAPQRVSWRIDLEPTTADDDPENDRLSFTVTSGLAPRFRLGYGDVRGSDVLLDAPFRIDTRRDQVPFMAFVPEYRDTDHRAVGYALWARATYAPGLPPPNPDEVRDLWTSGRGAVRLYGVTRNPNGSTEVMRWYGGAAWSPVVIDELGKTVAGSRYFNSSFPLKTEHSAWHRILRVPWTTVIQPALSLGTQGPQEAFFLSQLTIRVHRTFLSDYDLHRWAILRVVRDTLSRFAGRPNDRYYDAHFHTIAEGTFDLGLLSSGPAQSWAAPLAMAAESAYAQGFTESPDLAGGAAKDRIITTDHNQFYSVPSDHIPRDWTPHAGPTATATSGPQEFAIMRQLFGRGAGEEVSVAGGSKPCFVAPETGRHLLALDAPHFEGPWHGKPADNPNTIPQVLLTLRAAARAGPHTPSAFPAHPFLVKPDVKSPLWRMTDLERLLGLWPHNFLDAFSDEMVPLARGYQIWNMKSEANRPGMSASDFAHVDPWPYFLDPAHQNRNWLEQLEFDVERWMYFIRSGLNYRIGSSNPERYIRKIYGVGGTDAHGDFNYTADVAATILTNWAAHLGYSILCGGGEVAQLTRNAWGRVRTYAFAEDADPASALEAMTHGRAVVTDGPLVRVEIDANPRLRSDTLAYDHRVTGFDDDTQAANAPLFDADGQMGGGGPMEGLRTALVVVPDTPQRGASPHLIRSEPWIRYRVRNPEGLHQSGGALAEVSLWNLRAGVNEANRKRRCEILGRPVGSTAAPFDDDTAYHRPLFPDDQPSQVTTGALFARASTARITTADDGSGGISPYCDTDNSRADPVRTSVGVSNPVWFALGRYLVRADARCDASGNAKVTGIEARVTLPLSMKAPTNVFAQGLTIQGVSTGTRIPATRIEVEDFDGVKGRQLVLTWENIDLQLISNVLDSPGAILNSGSFVVVVGVFTDLLGNVLNPIAMVRHLPNCQGGTLCCELNDGPQDRLCFGNSRHGQCSACGAGCTARQRCERQGADQFACVADVVTGGCDNCNACCYNASCVLPAQMLTRDDVCGSCTGFCQQGERCCGGGCVARDNPAHCGACDNACAAGQSCCPGAASHACADLQNDRNNCGACGRRCDLLEQCCAGACIPYDDPSHCGQCNTPCTTGTRCCSPSGVGNAFQCVSVATGQNCGGCGVVCRSGSHCAAGACVPD